MNVPALGLKITSVPSGSVDGADDMQRRHGVAVAEADEMLLPVAPDAHFHPFRERVDHRGADAVQAAGNLVGILVELAARMQSREHHLGGGNALLDVHVGGDAAPVVADGDAAVAVQGQRDVVGKAGLRLINGVVDDFECHVVQAGPVIGIADIHSGSFADRIQALEDRDRRSVIGVGFGRRNGVFGLMPA